MKQVNTRKILSPLFLNIFICLLFIPFSGTKAEMSEPEGITRDEYESQCQEKWDKMWEGAKNGDLRMRSALAFSIFPWMHMNRTYMPGRSGDMISNFRDYLILMVHSQAAHIGNVDAFKNNDFIISMEDKIKRTPYKYEEVEEYIDCIKDKELEKRYVCVEHAVKDKLVPPFESYVEEIDALLAQGLRPVCKIDHHSNIGSRLKNK